MAAIQGVVSSRCIVLLLLLLPLVSQELVDELSFLEAGSTSLESLPSYPRPANLLSAAERRSLLRAGGLSTYHTAAERVLAGGEDEESLSDAAADSAPAHGDASFLQNSDVGPESMHGLTTMKNVDAQGDYREGFVALSEEDYPAPSE